MTPSKYNCCNELQYFGNGFAVPRDLGDGLGATKLYNDYLGHGKIWYAVVKSQKYGYVVGVTRNCVVTVFSRTDLPDFKRYVKGEILPLVTEQDT